MSKNGLIIYSKTGNTLGVAKKIENVGPFELLQVKATSDDPNQKEVKLTEIPDVESYDHLIFGSPVHGFSIPKVMLAYLKQLPDLSKKKIDLYVTHLFPFTWLGGSQCLSQIRKIITSKGGIVNSMTSVNWKSKKRDQTIHELVERFGKYGL